MGRWHLESCGVRRTSTVDFLSGLGHQGAVPRGCGAARRLVGLRFDHVQGSSNKLQRCGHHCLPVSRTRAVDRWVYSVYLHRPVQRNA